MEQKAELRIALRGEQGHALVLFADIENSEIYAGSSQTGRVDQRFRHSYHATGRRHTYTPVGRFSGKDDPPPQELRGFSILLQRATGWPEWGYKVKADSETRRTLIVDEADVPEGGCAMALIVEPDRPDLLAEIQAGSMFVDTNVIGSVVADWTSPQLIMLLLRHKTPRTSSPPGFVMGPPPGTPITWQLMGKVDKDGNVTHFAPKDS